ncbi:hypothetical protein M0811_05835 [Anaeramoeba ignava]|uniref:Calcineurin-like phosphoesterase domain-containing protein n=1 Tax=Anaeramoeba ignava TaxID=1746090 RepID=A0A9Q0LQ64_ANAIG|nr:hypothetical protein M0811_05835 [Anaeramoeba ignava]
MLSLFGTFLLIPSFIPIILCAKFRVPFFSYGYHALALILSSFEYNFLFEPIHNDRSKIWDPKYLFYPKENPTNSLWIGVVHYVYLFLWFLTYIQTFLFLKHRISSFLSRIFLIIPSAFFTSITLLAFPGCFLMRMFFFGISNTLIPRYVVFAPLIFIAIISIFLSLCTFETTIHLTFNPNQKFSVFTKKVSQIGKKSFWKKSINQENWKTLKIIQITDPHLGPWMSKRRLYKICKRAVKRKPDLILLTGDYLTHETANFQGTQLLKQALSPLSQMKGKVFACTGNHDLEYFSGIVEALEFCDIIVLKNRSQIIEINDQKIEILGFGTSTLPTVYRNVCQSSFKGTDLRIVLVHEPEDFDKIPSEHHSLSLTGHTHGGQIGLNFLGIPFTLMKPFVYDQGVYANSYNLMYIHKGTGFYGFPLRFGVQGEQSLMKIHYLPLPYDKNENINQDINENIISDDFESLEIEYKNQ